MTSSNVPAPAGSTRSLRALRAATSGRRLVVAGATVMALVAAAVTGIVLSDGPADRDGDRATGEAGAPVDEDEPAGGSGDGIGESDASDASEISATTTPTGTAVDPASDGEPGSDEGGSGGSGGSGGDEGGSDADQGDGTSDPGAPGGGSDGPGGSDDPDVPPGGSTTTTVPGGPPGTTTTTSTPRESDADPPEILSFRATVGARCGVLGLGRTVVLVWASIDAESASLGLLGILGRAVPPSGSLTRCVLLGDIYLLTVAGPGGQDTARLEIVL